MDKIINRYCPEKAFLFFLRLKKDFLIDLACDFSDNFSMGQWLRQYDALLEFINTQVYVVNFQLDCPPLNLRIYANVTDITPENVSLFKRIGIKAVLLGIESGNEKVLRENGKDYSQKEILEAARLLGAAGIKLADAYVLGLIGETEESLRDTIFVSEKIRELCEKEISYWNICTPLPGSKIWNLLLKVGPEFGRGYHVDIERAQREFVRHFTQVRYESLLEIQQKMRERGGMVSTEFRRL